MFQRDVKYRPTFRRAGERHHNFSITDRRYPRSVVREVQQEPNLPEHKRLRRQGDIRLRVRRSAEAEEARPIVQLHHVGERSVVRRSDVSGAIGSVAQSHRVDRADGLREIAGSQTARRPGEQFDVPETGAAYTDGRPRETPLLRKSPHLPVPRHGERIARFSSEKALSFERALQRNGLNLI